MLPSACAIQRARAATLGRRCAIFIVNVGANRVVRAEVLRAVEGRSSS
jgi:hypothetical protein